MPIKETSSAAKINPFRAKTRTDDEVIDDYKAPEDEKNLGLGLESKILSQVLNKKDISSLLRYLGAQDFTSQVNQQVFKFIGAFFRKYDKVPTVQVIQDKFPEFVYHQNVGDITYLIDQIHDRNRRSRMLWMLKQAALKVVNPDVQFEHAADYVNSGTRRLLEMRRRTDAVVNITESGEEYWKDYQELALKDGVTGLSTGLEHLDKITLGFKKGELIGICAFTGEGKTYLSMLLGMNVWKLIHDVSFFSLEMAKEQVARRAYALNAGVSVQNYLRGNLGSSQKALLRKSIEQLKNVKSKFLIDDEPVLSIPILESKLLEYRPELAIIDYASLMQGDRGEKDSNSRFHELIKGVKRCARVFNIPIILNCQATRDVGQGGKPPKLNQVEGGMPLSKTCDILISFSRLGANYFCAVLKNRNSVDDERNFKIIWSILGDNIIRAKTKEWRGDRLEEGGQELAQARTVAGDSFLDTNL